MRSQILTDLHNRSVDEKKVIRTGYAKLVSGVRIPKARFDNIIDKTCMYVNQRLRSEFFCLLCRI